MPLAIWLPVGLHCSVEEGVVVEIDISAGLLCRQGHFLLGKRSTHRKAYPGVWDLPGGHVETGEADGAQDVQVQTQAHA